MIQWILKTLLKMLQNNLQRVERKLHERTQSPKKQTRYSYVDGPMNYLGQQIVRKMQDAGYPSRIHCCYRPAEEQLELVEKGRSKANPWASPHQYMEAVDIIHLTLGWNVTQDYWDTLASAARTVADEHNIRLELGYDWGWDSAHIELKDFRTVRDKMWGKFRPSEAATRAHLQQRFKEVLPHVWKRYEKSKGFHSTLSQ